MVSDARRATLLTTLENLLTQERAGQDTPLQTAVGALVNTIHDGGLTGRAREQAIHTSRLALGRVLQGLGMSEKEATDLTKVLAAQEEQGQGSGGPQPARR